MIYEIETSGEAASQSLPNPFTICTWNIERGKRLQSIVDFINTGLAPDVLLLQEVDRFAKRTKFRDIASEVSAGTHMQQVFGVEFLELAQARGNVPALHGNMTLSRSQLNGSRKITFNSQPHDWGRFKIRIPWLQPRDGGRMAIVVELHCDGETVVVYNTHLESRANDEARAKQMMEILRDIEEHYSVNTSVIVAGDLNTARGTLSPVAKLLVHDGFRDVFQRGSAPLSTKPRRHRRLDWIFVRGLTVLDASVPRVRISDHYPIVAWLALNRPHSSMDDRT